jgi:hypothetical protein
MAEAFHGERKTDAHDAYVIAQTLRMRDDPPTLTVADGVQQQLKLLVSRRLDLVADRVRITARIQDLLTMISPALEKMLNLRSTGALRLLAQWQTPAGLRRAGEARILAYLRRHGVRAVEALTAKVLTAARRPRRRRRTSAGVPGRAGSAACSVRSWAAAERTTWVPGGTPLAAPTKWRCCRKR